QRKSPGGGGSHTGTAKKAHGLLRGNRRGRLTPESERQQFILWINEAVGSGARLVIACREVQLSLRTWRRWQKTPRDGRPEALRPVPFNRLSSEEEDNR
ncbi:hypothetical protein JK204_11905, partial [Tatumella sp. JGM16]|nr:hypothetical protein [Tatumella sp. JGM16]